MKTVTVTAAQPELRKLLEEAYNGEQVILAFGDKRVELVRYLPTGGTLEMDLEADSAELEAELLKAVRSKFTTYSRQDLEAVAERVKRERAA